jgi:hypothetical protein
MKVSKKKYFLQTPHIACWNFSTYVIRYVNSGYFCLTEIQQFQNEATAFKTNRPKSKLNKTQHLYFNADGGMSLTFRHRSFTFNSNKSPTWCNSFSVYYPDVPWMCVPVTTAWRVLRLRMEERPPIWRVAVNKLNEQPRTADEGWSSSLGVGRGANIPSP